MAMPLSTFSSDQGVKQANPSLRRMITCVACLLAAYFAVDRAVAYGLGKLVLNSQFRYSRLLSGGSNADIVIIGNSRGVNGFYAPDIEAMTGKKVLNLSYNGLSMEGGLLMFENYLERNNAPTVLILEITNLHISGYPEEILQLYSGVEKTFHNKWTALRPKQSFIATNLSHVYCYNNEMFLRTLAYQSKTDQNWINRYKIDETFAETFKPAPWMHEQWRVVQPTAMNALHRLVQIAKIHKIRVEMVVTPYLPEYINNIPEYVSWVEAVKKELGSQQIIWDFSSALADNRYFADPLHMNFDGFQQFKPGLSRVLRP